MKRLFDFLVALLFFFIGLPLWIIISVLIKIESKGPILFRQTRIGRHGKHFRIFKFRTMVVDAEKKGLQLTVGGRDPRITKVGYILRKTKLDEFPQLLNVITGEMSLVGPRPEVPKYVKMYTPEQRKVLSVRPGITDIASIEYINENELLKESENPEKLYIEKIMQDKLKLNLQYINCSNFFYDMKLIIRTLIRICYR